MSESRSDRRCSTFNSSGSPSDEDIRGAEGTFKSKWFSAPQQGQQRTEAPCSITVSAAVRAAPHPLGTRKSMVLLLGGTSQKKGFFFFSKKDEIGLVLHEHILQLFFSFPCSFRQGASVLCWGGENICTQNSLQK